MNLIHSLVSLNLAFQSLVLAETPEQRQAYLRCLNIDPKKIVSADPANCEYSNRLHSASPGPELYRMRLTKTPTGSKWRFLSDEKIYEFELPDSAVDSSPGNYVRSQLQTSSMAGRELLIDKSFKDVLTGGSNAMHDIVNPDSDVCISKSEKKRSGAVVPVRVNLVDIGEAKFESSTRNQIENLNLSRGTTVTEQKCLELMRDKLTSGKWVEPFPGAKLNPSIIKARYSRPSDPLYFARGWECIINWSKDLDSNRTLGPRTGFRVVNVKAELKTQYAQKLAQAHADLKTKFEETVAKCREAASFLKMELPDLSKEPREASEVHGVK